MFSDLQKKAVSFLTDNSAAILTAGGVVGTVATGVLSARAALRAQEIIDAEKQAIREQEGWDEDVEPNIPKTAMVKVLAPEILPPVLVGVATIAAIIMANRVSAQRAAVLAAAYGVSSKQVEEYRAKLEEKLTPKKFDEARGEIQQERLDKRPLSDNMILVGTGPVVCYDAFSDRYFKSTADHIRRAVNVVNGEIDTGGECKLGVFYHELELPQTRFDDMLGWNERNPCKITIDAMMINDSEACLCIEFTNLPQPNWDADYS